MPTFDNLTDDRPRQVLFLITMSAMAFIGDALTNGAVPPLQCEYRFNAQVWQAFENLMSGISIVVSPYAGMVPAEHMVTTT